MWWIMGLHIIAYRIIMLSTGKWYMWRRSKWKVALIILTLLTHPPEVEHILWKSAVPKGKDRFPTRSVFSCSIISLNHNGWLEKSTLNLTPNLTPFLIRIPQKTLRKLEGSKVMIDHYEPSSSTKYTPSTSKIAMENPPCVFICWYISYCKRRTSIATLDVTCDVFPIETLKATKFQPWEIFVSSCVSICSLPEEHDAFQFELLQILELPIETYLLWVNLGVFCCSPSWD